MSDRLGREELLAAAAARTPDEIHALGEAALADRRGRFGDTATYVCNLQVNPSNLCVGGCRFCDFSVRPGSGKGYVLDEEEIFAKVAETGPTEVHVVGGLNEEWDYRRSLELVRDLRSRWPELHIKAFTAVEIDWFARDGATSTARVLERFREAGLNALPGGGAEVFSDRIRAKYCPDKLDPAGWLRIHGEAHRLGLTSNATMLAGLGETPEERVDHLLALRDAQDESGGFSCFIPLAYQTGGRSRWERTLSATEILALIALARLALDNFPHVKAYWPMIGLETASAALSWGADDLDGTIGGERIAHAAGAKTPVALARDRMQETIRLGGFTPVERDGAFAPVGGAAA
jgi:aminodeoxyfutalosine synthase